MNPETNPAPPATEPPSISVPGSTRQGSPGEDPPGASRGLKWIFVGPQGLRVGWSAVIFISLTYLLESVFGLLFFAFHLISTSNNAAPQQQFFSELFQILALLCATIIMAVIEGRSILDYNLHGKKQLKHFLSGLVVGFAALSALVASLASGHWLRFGPVALNGVQILEYGAIWGAVFLMVACFEEGSMRCYLQYTLTRGINFWWAFGSIACLCALLILAERGNGARGVYIIASLGLVPCLLVHVRGARCAGFWNAAWLTSTLFGAMHTGNNGENWIGIFAAAFIGFVFCVSIWVTGSAWWAIGCHAAWDWAETYFYGTADSGFVAPGHLLSTSPAGNPLWSGGTDGPEGSLIIIPIVLLLLAWLLVIYRRPKPEEFSVPAPSEQLAS